MYIFYLSLIWQLLGIELKPYWDENAPEPNPFDPAEGDWKDISGTAVYMMRIFSDPAGLPAYDYLEK